MQLITAERPLIDQAPLITHVVPAETLPEGCRDPLEVLARVAPRALALGSLYELPFFSGRRGPSQHPVEIDVLVPSSVEGALARGGLREAAPQYRWRVVAADTVVGPGANPIQRALAAAPLVAMRGGVRLWDGAVLYHFVHRRALQHLRDGRLEPAGGDLEGAAREARWILQRFPGLVAGFLGHGGRPVDDSFDEIARKVAENEHGGRARALSFTERESELVAHIRDWHRANPPRISPPPLPPRVSLPAGDPWSATDAEFREWLIDQALTRERRTPRDLDLFRMLEVQVGEQKPTHQGWEIFQHSIYAALTVETDHLPGHRRSLRIAMLLHDIGKLFNLWTPGSHPLIGAKQWKKVAPSWLTPMEAEEITLLIRNHDVLGLMDRGIMSEDFRGAMGPAEIRDEITRLGLPLRQGLALFSAVYQADIGSVAALRWLLPLTPVLEQLVLLESDV